MIVFEILFYAFIVVIFIQFLFYGFVFGSFLFSKETKPKFNAPPISVIICAKNEAKNLETFLPYIISQDYPNFEIVLINDNSTDKTLKVMQRFQSEHPAIKIVNVKNNEAFWGKKKYALTLGIKAANHKHLLFIDADCKPVSNKWISEMSSHFSKTKTLILGYGAYAKEKSWLNKLIRYETLVTALQYFSYAKLGHPYMGVGRNLAYSSDLFYENRGFMNHMDVRSGDDDLFVNQASSSENTAICTTVDSFTESIPKRTFTEWIAQKRRHIDTAKHYQWKHKITLSIFYTSQLLFWVLAFILLLSLHQFNFVLGLIIARFIFVILILGIASKRFRESDLIPFFPMLELFLIVSQFYIFIKNKISKPIHWK